ncbi:MAG: DUF2142 domain-containing protein [Clostridia bacterium]|nr:DUF2142 domain-containing protein [Clostridia bacterium]
MFKKVFAAILVLAVVLTCGLSIISPPKNLYRYTHTSEDTVKVLKAVDIDAYEGCSLSKEGVVEVTDSGAAIVFTDIGADFRSIRINTERFKEHIPVQVLVDKGAGYVTNDGAYAYFLEGDNGISLNVDGQGIVSLKIIVESSYLLESVELHSNEAKSEIYEISVSPLYYILVILLSLGVAFIYAVADKKFALTDKIFAKLKAVKSSVIKGIIALVISGAAAYLCELVAARSLQSEFNTYRFILIWATVLIASLFFLCRKTAATKPQNILVGIILILGIAFSVVRPFGHASWDFDSHYSWSLCSSYAGTVYVTEADRNCMNADVDSYIAQDAQDNFGKISRMNKAAGVLSSIEYGFPRITHLPFGIFMALARFFGASFYLTLTLGRIGNVILYALLCYFAVKKLKSGKMVLSVTALFPTALFQASSLSYDVWIIGFVFLGMAYFISGNVQGDKKMSPMETAIMCGAFALACLPKAIYAGLLLIPFFMRKNTFINKKKNYIICAAAFAFVILFFAAKSLIVVSGTGDVRGGAVNPMQQISFILGDPLNYAKILFDFLKDYLSPAKAYEYITNFAYANIGKGSIILLILAVLASFTDRGGSDIRRFTLPLKSVICLIFAITVVLIATSMYVAFTPVGYETINGCQPRYILPLIYPLLSVVGIEGIKNNCNRTFYNYLMLIPCVCINLYNIATVFLPRII